MGRETRILLGLLGLLAGLFVGVLSLKLLVPRPPVGAGPDVHGDVAFTVRQEIVPPPVRGPRAADFAAAPPLVGSMPGSMTAASPFAAATPSLADASPADAAGLMADEPPPSRFASAPPAVDREAFDTAPATSDPFVRRAAFAEEEPARPEPTAGGSRFARPTSDGAGMEPAVTSFPTIDGPPGDPAPTLPASRFGGGVEPRGGEPPLDQGHQPAAADPFAAGRTAGTIGADAPVAPQPTPPPMTAPREADPFRSPQGPVPLVPDERQPVAVGPITGSHVVAGGDSWWSLAERAYGDGRLYRALYAWNRARDPRVALVPGTSLEIPPIERLAASWPALVPAGR